MFLSIHPDNPQQKAIDQAVEILRIGGVIIYPTDTMYALGCDIQNKKAVQALCRLKGIDPDKANLTCVCEDIAIIGTYALHVTTPMYKLMRSALPGPYTFILQASKEIPRHFQRKKTFGIRVPNHSIPVALAKALGNPIASLSIPIHEDAEFNTDPSLIYERFNSQVDLVIDGGIGSLDVSTVIDCSRGEHDVEVIREGSGSLEQLGLTLAE
ncbi:MAG: L-threonylcarbamoyladenylate synthase [Bacteroidia bacterium]|nr:L-threonylcarbamoyladenylate synthase [Bacteroidia bacterium]